MPSPLSFSSFSYFSVPRESLASARAYASNSMSAYLIHLCILIGIYVILATSLNLAMGFTGLLNLGHIAFFGVGAYTSALLTMAGVPFVVAFFLAGIFAALFGVLLLLATRNLKGDYLGLATLGF